MTVRITRRRPHAGATPLPPTPPARPRRGAPLRGGLLVPACAAAMLLLAGCLVSSQPLETLPDGGTVARLTGAPPPAAPPHAIFQELGESHYRTSLRRIVVAHSTWVSFLHTEPQPLLTEPQVERFAAMLARELPRLKPGQRLDFRFPDGRSGLRVDMQVFPEGDRLAFLFTALARESDPGDGAIFGTLNRATLVPQAGQTVEQLRDSVVLREPVRLPEVARAQAQQDNLNAIRAARGKELIDEDEAEALRELAVSPVGIQPVAFSSLFRRLEVLEKARGENLLTEEEFQSRRRRLMAELKEGKAPAQRVGEQAQRARKAGLELIEQAEAERLLGPAESARLKQIVGRSPGPSIDQVRDFLRKRATLKQARQQELLSEAEFRDRLERLTVELAR